MNSVVVLYRGDSRDSLEMVAASGDPAVVADVASRMLGTADSEADPILHVLETGRRKALELARDEAATHRPNPRLSIVSNL